MSEPQRSQPSGTSPLRPDLEAATSPAIIWSWQHHDPPPKTERLETRIRVTRFASGLSATLRRAPRLNVRSLSFLADATKAAADRVVSVPVVPPKLRVTSVRFVQNEPLVGSPLSSTTALKNGPEASELRAQHGAGLPGEDRSRAARSCRRSGTARTRLRVPRDIVKLEDRLFYLLQPPLETWMARLALEVPFEPFAYQYEGVAFLYPRLAAILADEMGLGKTMQAITAIRLLLHAGEVRRVLLLCPKPLVSNWQREFGLWAPEVPVGVVQGHRSQRAWQWQHDRLPVKIANYELLHRDADLLTAPETHFDLVVLDESQRIKNRASRTSKVARSIPRTRSWALTGTPVENSADDLVGIFEFLSPGYLSSQMKPRQMGRLVSDYVLRRTKDSVLTQLPPKLYRDAELELSPEQRHSYRLAEEQGVLRLTELGEAATIQHVLELVLRLKQICNFDPATGESSKLDRLEADLEEVAASRRKAIVFSQWVETLEKLGRRLRRFSPLAYHGKVPHRRRGEVLRQFKEDPQRSVLLMSYGTGSVGLNLQFASYVFLFDRWWNPAVEDQAINRAHRIGAVGPVTVTRFLTLGTIEERIDQVLSEKRELFHTILSGAAGPRNLGMSRDEIFGLFQLRTPRNGGSSSQAA